jgi:pimeloyl-ACP methyl ester carboxylesterase
MKKQTGFAEVMGTRLYYEVAGSGRPMILIHGFTLDSRMWDDQFESFAQQYQVIRYDLRGFGKSSLPNSESYSYADDLKALIDHLGVSHAYVIGLSMGGKIAIDFALEHPEATDALVAADSALGGFQWQDFKRSLESVWARASKSGVQAGKEVWQGLDLFKPAVGKPDVASRLAQMFSDYSGWHFVNDDPVSELDPPAIQRLNDISTPTLVIIGEYDSPDFHSISSILHEQIIETRKVVIPGVGHMSNMEGPERFNEIVLDFLVNL